MRTVPPPAAARPAALTAHGPGSESSRGWRDDRLPPRIPPDPLPPPFAARPAAPGCPGRPPRARAPCPAPLRAAPPGQGGKVLLNV
jgi:hypothetical protein